MASQLTVVELELGTKQKIRSACVRVCVCFVWVFKKKFTLFFVKVALFIFIFCGPRGESSAVLFFSLGDCTYIITRLAPRRLPGTMETTGGQHGDEMVTKIRNVKCEMRNAKYGF